MIYGLSGSCSFCHCEPPNKVQCLYCGWCNETLITSKKLKWSAWYMRIEVYKRSWVCQLLSPFLVIIIISQNLINTGLLPTICNCNICEDWDRTTSTLLPSVLSLFQKRKKDHLHSHIFVLFINCLIMFLTAFEVFWKFTKMKKINSMWCETFETKTNRNKSFCLTRHFALLLLNSQTIRPEQTKCYYSVSSVEAKEKIFFCQFSSNQKVWIYVCKDDDDDDG